MREAFGGVFMIRLMLVFIFVFVAFGAISLNYAKAFKVKNNVIDFIEQQEVMDLDDVFKSSNNSRIVKLNKLLNDSDYKKSCENGNGPLQKEAGTGKAYCYNGIVIDQAPATGKDNRIIVYKVYTYADWNLGVLNLLLVMGGRDANQEPVHGTWVITGEARVVKRDYGN